jgi:hypothetical protein
MKQIPLTLGLPKEITVGREFALPPFQLGPFSLEEAKLLFSSAVDILV